MERLMRYRKEDIADAFGLVLSAQSKLWDMREMARLTSPSKTAETSDPTSRVEFFERMTRMVEEGNRAEARFEIARAAAGIDIEAMLEDLNDPYDRQLTKMIYDTLMAIKKLEDEPSPLA